MLLRDDLDEAEKKEMLELNGKEIGALLAALEGLDAAKRAKYEGQIDKVAGLNPRRMRLSFKAVTAKQAGKPAKDFAFDNWDLCRDLYMGQRQTVFKYVEPGLKDPKKIEPGDLIKFKDGRQGVAHQGYVRRQAAKNQVTWMANNPGGLASAGVLEAATRYPGKKIDGRLDVFPSYEAGVEGIRAFLKVMSGLGRTVTGYVNAHAPGPLPVDPKEATDPELKKKNDAQRHATAGNNPKGYLDELMGSVKVPPTAHPTHWPPEKRMAKLADLTADEFEQLVQAIAHGPEGYDTTGGDELRWPAGEKELERDAWWSMVFWEHG
jgi:hypothetical protein